MHIKLVIIALCVYGLSLVGMMLAGDAHAPFIKAQPPAVATTSPVAMPDPLVGFTLNFHHTRDLSRYLDAVDEIAALGFNSLQVVTPAFQEHGASQTIRIEYGPGLSPTRQDLVELLLYARSKGLSTTLMPIVLFSRPRGNEWRGKIQPEQWSPWWNSYQRMLDYFVDVAVECDVQMLSVGSELLTTETNFEAWQRLIQRVRSKYRGKLIYSTNWDHYHVPTFWGQLDYIGVSGYWDMTTLAPKDQPPGASDLARRWTAIRQRLQTFSSEKNRPVIITEIGYPSLPWALKNPWNYVAGSKDARQDVQAQAMGYRAFLAAWEDVLTPAVAPAATSATAPSDRSQGLLGFYFYAWDVYYQGGPDDTGYGVKGKPAYQVLQRFMTRQGFLKHAANQ